MSSHPHAPEISAAELSRLWQQDAEIDGLIRALLAATDAGDLETARERIEVVTRAVLAHLQEEEDVYFPAAERLAPDFASELRTIRLAHLGIRKDLEDLEASLAAGHLAVARTLLEAFIEGFGLHERAEERIVAQLRGTDS